MNTKLYYDNFSFIWKMIQNVLDVIHVCPDRPSLSSEPRPVCCAKSCCDINS